jgi:hypothetical protein
VLLALCLHREVQTQFAIYGHYVAPYLEIVASIPKNSRLFPLDIDPYRFKETREATLGQLHGYAAAITSSYDGHLFDYPTNPLRFRDGRQLPHPDWRQPRQFTMSDHGRFYDYIIVHPIEEDFIGKRWHRQLTLVRQAGDWRLYKVKQR